MAYQRLAYGLSTNPEETRVEYLQRAISENNVCGETHTHTQRHTSQKHEVFAQAQNPWSVAFS